MNTGFEGLFGVRTLTGLIQTFADDSREKFFSQIFERGERTKVEGHTFEWDEVRFNRTLAPIVGPTSIAPETPVTDRIHRLETLVDIKHYVFIPAERLFRERAPGELKPNASLVVANELKNLRMMVEKTVEYLCVNTLLGKVEINAQTVPGSDYTDTITYDVGTFKRGAAWTDKTTLIPNEVTTIVDQYTRDTGRFPQTVIHNITVEQALLANDEIQKLCANQAYAGRIFYSDARENRVMDGLRIGGLDWKKSLGYYQLAGSPPTRFMPDYKLIILPEDAFLPQTIGLVEGSGIIPRNAYGVEGDLGLFELAAPGYYAYSVLSANPIGLQLFAGWRGLPYLRYPGGVFVGTVN